MADQWLRQFSLVIGDKEGNGLDLSELHCRFEITRAAVQTPAQLTARVYNLSKETVQKIQKEFTHVWLQAGYEQNYGLIFGGEIRQKVVGRENSTDTFLEMIAADGDSAYNWGITNSTLAAGYNKDDQIKVIADSLQEYEITNGYLPEFDKDKAPRGKVMFGMTRDYLRTLSKTANCTWRFEDGKLNVVPADKPIPNEAVVLTSATGMIGMPQQTIDGIMVRCLINPSIRMGTMVKIDNASVQNARISVAYGYVNTNPDTSLDGLYLVYGVNYVGDTRGQSWYCDLACIANEGMPPLSRVWIEAVPSRNS